MATSEEREMFRKLVDKGLSNERAKTIIVSMRDTTETPTETTTEPTTEPTTETTIKPITGTLDELNTEIGMTQEEVDAKAQSSDVGFLEAFKQSTPFIGHSYIGEVLTEGGKPLVEQGKELMTEAKQEKTPAEMGETSKTFLESMGKLFDTTKGGNMWNNAIPDFKESVGEIEVMFGDIPGVLSALTSNAKALTKGGLDNQLEGTFLEGVFDPTKEEKQMQDDFIANMQDVFINPETGELKSKLELSDDAVGMVKENPLILLTALLKIGTKIKRGGAGDLAKADQLMDDAEKLIIEGIDPSTKPLKLAAADIARDFLEKGIVGTPTEIMEMVKEQLTKAQLDLKDVKGGLNSVIDLKGLEEIITKYEKGLTAPDGTIMPSAKLSAKELDLIKQDLIKYLDDNAEMTQKLGLDARDFFWGDKYKDADLSTGIEKLRTKVGDNIAKALNESDPDLASINAQVHFYATLETLFKETKIRKSSQKGGMDTTNTANIRTAFAALGAGLANFTGASPFLGALLGTIGSAKFNNMITSPKFKFAKAQDKKKLADALIRGDKKSIEQAMDIIIISQGIGTEEEIKESIGKQSGQISEEGIGTDMLNRLIQNK